MKRLRLALPLLIMAALVLVLAQGLKLDPRVVDSPLVGKPAPAFSLPVLGGDQLLTEQTLAQKVSMFNVWSSWCVACRVEHPILVALSKRSDITLYGLNYKDKTQDAMNWLERNDNPYIASGQDLDGAVGIDWGVYGVPETFIIDKQGVIRAKRIGPLTWPYVNDELLPLLRRLEAES
jgi:cytochrome c biogenesis protein CcmG/thiol:disulfide interchange protein DsbE